MAKTGFKGFGGFAGSGADSTLVGAAFNAAMAGVPKDYTKIFNNISTHYDKAMQKVGAGWAKVAEAVGKIGATAVEEFKKQEDLEAAGGNVNEGFTAAFEERLNFIKDIKSDSGLLSYVDGEKESLEYENPHYNPNQPESESNSKTLKFENKREARKYAKRMEDNLYAGIAQAEKSFNLLGDMVKNKQIDLQMSGEDNLAFASVLAAGGGEVTNKDGEVIGKAMVGFDKKGFPLFTFLDKDGNIKKNKHGVLMQGGKDDIENMLIVKNPKAVETIQKYEATLYKAGMNGGKWEDQENGITTALENLTANQNSLMALMGAKWGGNMDESFMEALHKPGFMTATIFNQLTDKYNFEKKEDGAKFSIYDLDKDGDVDYKDYKKGHDKFVSAITDQTNPLYDAMKSRDIFINWVKDNPMKAEFNKGNTVYRTKNNQNNQSETFNQNEKSLNIDEGGKDVILSGDVVENVHTMISNGVRGQVFEGWKGNKDGSWTRGKQTISGDQFLDFLSNQPKYQNFNFKAHGQFRKFRTNAGYDEKFNMDTEKTIRKFRTKMQESLEEIDFRNEDLDLNDKTLYKKLNKIKAFTDQGYTFDATMWDGEEMIKVMKNGKEVTKLKGGKGTNTNLLQDIRSLIEEDLQLPG